MEKVKRAEKMKQVQQISPNPQIAPEAILGSHIDDSWLIKYNDIEFSNAIGKGTYGKVFKGIYKGLVCLKVDGRLKWNFIYLGNKVAIKVIKAPDKEGFEEFAKEFQVMRYKTNK